MRAIRHLAATTLLAAAMGAHANAPKEGSYDFTACWSGTASMVAFSKTHWGLSFEMTGSTRSNPPGAMFDKHAFRCVGTNARFDKEPHGNAICEAVDRDGHKRLTYFETGADGKVQRRFIAGTGKYEGMTETSAGVEQLGPFPTIKPGTFQNCNRQTGTYKMK